MTLAATRRRYGLTLLPLTIASGALALMLAGNFAQTRAAEQGTLVPPPAQDAAPASSPQSIVLAGGCFWGVQGVFQHVKGVEQAVSGYAGGSRADAHYQSVGGGRTGHAESVKVTFDPKRVSLGQILRVYFSVAHDPTQLNRQGPDSGPQYRSAIFASDAVQEKIARDYIAQIGETHVFNAPIVTRLESLTEFYPAEKYHQDYLSLHPTNPYILINDLPKVENLKRLFPSLYSETPKLVAGE